jgi:prepilin-type N-terminal cleavage/methylation domain-containing protein
MSLFAMRERASSFNSEAGRTRSMRRRGFTLIELMIAVSLMGIIFSIAFPKMRTAKRRSDVHAASSNVSSYLSVTRAAAIRRGRPAKFWRSNNKIWVTVDEAGTQTVIRDTVYLDNKYRATLTASVDTVRYDPRGYTRYSTNQTFVVSSAGIIDTVCIAPAGMLLKQGCGI